MSDPYDLFIIGGGINGTGIARDAAGRGLSVFLCERDDLASGTSSASTKLIHGGLRYLEQYEFRLVRESLMEREVLWRTAPHIIKPMDFILPHHRGLRPAFVLRLGLFIYDHIGGRKLLPSTKTLNLRQHPAGASLKDEFKKGFQYADCWVDDARMVVLNAVDAADRGACILTRTSFKTAVREQDVWRVTVCDADGNTTEIRARTLVNAAGPSVFEARKAILGSDIKGRVRLVKGSHMIVPRMFDTPQSFILQNDDQRIFFAIPYHNDFTLIGTTDVPFDGDARGVSISPEEIQYLCDGVNAYFKQTLSPADVVGSYSGVRPLYNDGSAEASEVTRDYTLTVHDANDKAPLMSVYGGKITSYRKLSEQALNKLKPYLRSSGPDWTAQSILPGGDIDRMDVPAYQQQIAQRYPGLPPTLINRLVTAYGTRCPRILGKAKSEQDLGRHFGADLYELEVEYLIQHEWAVTADDILWRRSKLGLLGDTRLKTNLESWLSETGRAEAQKTMAGKQH